VVAKLFAGIQPHVAYFGRKDAQQLAIVKRMAKDLSMPVRVIGAPIVREADGLALSSRNIFLSQDERECALMLNRGLMSAANLVEAGETDAGKIIAAAHTEIGDGLKVEYVALAGQDLVQPLIELDRPAFLALAAWSGETRLIDNVHFDKADGGYVADRGIRLARPSVLYGIGGS
jgi:pantoate--beta-alanine ligase